MSAGGPNHPGGRLFPPAPPAALPGSPHAGPHPASALLTVGRRPTGLPDLRAALPHTQPGQGCTGLTGLNFAHDRSIWVSGAESCPVFGPVLSPAKKQQVRRHFTIEHGTDGTQPYSYQLNRRFLTRARTSCIRIFLSS